MVSIDRDSSGAITADELAEWWAKMAETYAPFDPSTQLPPKVGAHFCAGFIDSVVAMLVSYAVGYGVYDLATMGFLDFLYDESFYRELLEEEDIADEGDPRVVFHACAAATGGGVAHGAAYTFRDVSPRVHRASP
eukprot:SAG11_NODE_1256_length_5374_cov_5.627627_4_plen_135_part_00